jgi:hypothetical protein
MVTLTSRGRSSGAAFRGVVEVVAVSCADDEDVDVGGCLPCCPWSTTLCIGWPSRPPPTGE